MATDRAIEQPVANVRMFWWVFAVRGGLAVVFAMVLFLASSFLGIFFFDPVTLVYMSLLLGSYVLGNGLLLGVAAGFGFEHHLHLRWLTLCESCFALLLGVYIGISLILSPVSPLHPTNRRKSSDNRTTAGYYRRLHMNTENKHCIRVNSDYPYG